MRLLTILFAVFSVSQAQATDKFLFNLSDVRLGAIAAFHPGHGGNGFGQIAWAPRADFGHFAMRGELGWTALRNAHGDRVGVTHLEIYGQQSLSHGVNFELGAGTQNWGGGTGDGFAISAGMMIDDFFFDYSHVLLGPGINLYRLGYTVRLF